ncbi:MAG: S-layer family protein, partial [Coleofasciculus sp. G2-EDA-02]
SGDVLVEGEDMDTLFPSALRTDTFGKGDAGSLTVNTPVLIMEDGALISSSTFPGSSGFPGSTGDGGDITVVASESVQLSESRLTSQMGGEGDAGNVRINTAQLQLDSGGQIESGTLGEGDAGDILLQVEDSLTISGDFSGVFADTGGDSSGNGGSIIIDSKKVVVRDGGQIAVESQGTGDAGNLTVIAESIYLENGRLNAESANGRGGNIQLKVKDVLLLRGNSLISAFSGVEGNDGIDGNITIDTTFLIAIPNEDSDIVATGLGRSVGSNIQVNAQRIFGTQFRQQLTPDNDIVATGTVVLNTPDIDPTQDLAPLPITFIDMSNQVNNSCSPYGRLASGENKFIITGRGGIPASPSQSLNPEAIWEDWRFVDETEGTEPIQLSPRMINNESISGDKPRQIVEAQGWYRDAQGNVILTADSTMVTPHETGWNSANCLSEKP